MDGRFKMKRGPLYAVHQHLTGAQRSARALTLWHSAVLQFTGFPPCRLRTTRRTSVFLNLEHFPHRAPVCRPDLWDGCIQSKRSHVNTNTVSHSHSAEHKGCSWNVLKTSTVRCRAPVSSRVADYKYSSSWATLTNCFSFGVPAFLTWNFQ